MIFVDTSAIVAMLAGEPESAELADRLEQSRERITAGHVLLEASMRLSTLLDFAPIVADSLVTRSTSANMMGSPSVVLLEYSDQN